MIPGRISFAALPRVALDKSALALLVEDRIACRLVTTWPRIPAQLDDDERLAYWSQLSGVHPFVIAGKLILLFGNGFCDAVSGSADPDALNFIRGLAMSHLRLPRAQKPKPKDETPTPQAPSGADDR